MATTWDEAFADRYEEWSASMTADVAFYVDIVCQADGPLVELAIGNGRVAIPVARAAEAGVRGEFPVVGDQKRVARTYRRGRPGA